MKDNILGYETLEWIIEQSEEGLFVATATPRMQRAIADRYRYADVCVFDFTEGEPYYFAILARLFRDEPGKRAYFLLNTQRALTDGAAMERFNFSRDMLAREKKNLVFFMTEEAAQRVNRGAYDLHSYIRLFLDFEDDTPDAGAVTEAPAVLPDRSVGVAPPKLDFSQPRAALLAKAISLSNTAQKYYDDGRYRDAETLWRGTLTIRERLLGGEHPDTAAALYQLGGTCERQARYDEALALLQRALKIQLRTVGKQHPDTATTYNNIALVYADTGEYGKALAYYQKALATDEAVLGEQHPDTAACYNNIAGVYYATGEYGKALAYCQKALSVFEAALGKDHPHTIVVRDNLDRLRRETQA